MTSWREEYIQTLKDRDIQEREGYQRLTPEFIEACKSPSPPIHPIANKPDTTLLDRTAALSALAATTSPNSPNTNPSKIPSISSPQLQSDLAEALRSAGALQTRVKASEAELVKLRAKTQADTKTIAELSKERTFLRQKLKDRDEELRGKTKLLDDVHDETISLNLQLNMAEQRTKALEAENKELIDRWMARKGREAEEMNRTLQGGK